MFNYTQTNINSSPVASYRPVFSCPQSPNFVWDTTNEIFPWIMVAIVSIASPAAVILNILVISAVKSRKELQKNSNILLLSSMAVADILVGAINMPLSALVEFVISRQVFNNAICQVDLVNVYLMFAFTGCSLYHLTLIAWERYQAIGKCFEYKAKMTKRRLKKLAITAWFLAAVTHIPGIVLTALEINHDFIIEAVAAFFALILVPYFYIMVYRETRKRKLTHITQITFLVKAKLENRVAITCALVSTAVILSFVPLVTVGLLGELYPVLRNNYVFRSTETLLQMNSIVNPLLYCYRNRRFRNIVLEILCIRNLPAAKTKVGPSQVVRLKDRLSSMEDTLEKPNVCSRRLLSKSASCELSNVTELIGAMKKRPVSAPSIIRLRSNSPQSQNPSTILTVVATVHPKRSQGHSDSFSMFHPSSSKDSKKSWKVKCNLLNVSDPPQDLIKEQYAFNCRNLIKYLTRSASCNESTGSCGTSPRSRESLLKRSMSAPSLGQIKRSCDDTMH